MTASTDLVRPERMVANYEGWFAQLLPSHVPAAQFVRVAVGALRRDPKLMRAAESSPESLIEVLQESARLGLEPGTKEFWLIPRRIKGKDTVTGFPGWEGYIELMFRAGAVSSVKAEVVYERDTFRYSPTMDRPEHDVDWFGERGKVRGAYAYAEMVGGGVSKVVIIGPKDIEDAKRTSAGSADPGSPWVTHYADMVLKTAVRQLQKWVPTSAEYRREQLRAVATVAAEVAGPVAQVATAPIYAPSERIPTDVPGVEVDADGVMHAVDADVDVEDPPY